MIKLFRFSQAAHSLTTRHFPYDPWLLLAAATLSLLGWIMVTSASLGLQADSLHYFRLHGIYLLLGVTALLVVACLPMEAWRQNAVLLLGLCLLMLLAVLVVGQEVNGSKRWLPLPGPLPSLQASEFAKIGLVIYMAAFMHRFVDELRRSPVALWRPLVVLSIPAGLLYLAPDLGAIVVFSICVLGMLVMAGASILLLLLIGGVLGGLAVFAIREEPYRLARWSGFLDPWADQFETGYQLTQALIAFGRGHWTGTGLGNSVQKLEYLPEAHTDFIFAVIAEELGLVGTVLVVALFTLLIMRAALIARRAELAGRLFGAYTAYGIAFIIAAQTFINMAVSSGLAPTKGLTLPLISYGGSSLLVTAIMIGLLIRVDIETRRMNQRPRADKASRRGGPL